MTNSVDSDQIHHSAASYLALDSTLFAQACLSKYLGLLQNGNLVGLEFNGPVNIISHDET